MRTFLVSMAIALASGGVLFADPDSSAAAHSAFFEQYSQSVSRMGAPDATFEEVSIIPTSHGPGPIPLASSSSCSTTCSQRCSTRCSVSCTTTRGCSTRCKAQTEGCTTGNSQEASAAVPYSPPTTDQTTFNVQRALVIAGYHLCADGQMTAQTHSALLNFQQRQGLAVTGAVDSETWQALVPLLRRVAS